MNEEEKNDNYQEEFNAVMADLEDFIEIPVTVHVLLGIRDLTIKEFLGLEVGSVIDLKMSAGDSLKIMLGNIIFAKGEVTIIEETFGVRLVEIIDPRKV